MFSGERFFVPAWKHDPGARVVARFFRGLFFLFSFGLFVFLRLVYKKKLFFFFCFSVLLFFLFRFFRLFFVLFAAVCRLLVEVLPCRRARYSSCTDFDAT